MRFSRRTREWFSSPPEKRVMWENTSNLKYPMTLKEFVEKNGKEICVSKMRQWQSVTIGFINADGKDDETEFDVYRVDTSAGLEELAQLFNDFCAENNFPTNTVQSVRVVKSADDYSDLA